MPNRKGSKIMIKGSKFISLLLILTAAAGIIYAMIIRQKTCPLYLAPENASKECSIAIEDQDRDYKKAMGEAFELLLKRKDGESLAILEKILATTPDDFNALWGKAEVFRRQRQFKDSEAILNTLLSRNPCHAPTLISLAYIKYINDDLKGAQKMIQQVLDNTAVQREDRAMAYMMLGTINSRRSSKGIFLAKIKYGTQIKRFFLEAKKLSPELPEVCMGLGTFYLLAPSVVGGNLNKALNELQLAVKIAPDFATANARLAQAYKKSGDVEKYNFYLRRAEELDPANEVVRELKK